jgi:isopentenyldiphosphate isomerase
MAEIIDIYDANLGHLGTMERLEAHLKGHWHKTFHCWVVNGEDGGGILFQHRSAEMVNFPNMFDVSAAGHLEAGESIEQGIREVSEELGVPITIESLQSLGYRVEVADQSNGQLNREYQVVYMLRLDIPLSEYKPQVEEVSGLFWLKIRDGLKLFSGSLDKAVMQGILYNKSLERWEQSEREVSVNDFLPRIQNYYLTACIMGERLSENRLPLAIS